LDCFGQSFPPYINKYIYTHFVTNTIIFYRVEIAIRERENNKIKPLKFNVYVYTDG